MPLTVLLADDHVLFRQGLKALLEHDDLDVVAEASDAAEAIRLASNLKPDVAILDFMMPGVNGVEAARQIKRLSPATRTILLTMYTEDQYVMEALRAGVKGYVVKTQAAADLIKAIHEVSRNGVYLSPIISSTIVDACVSGKESAADPLSDREREVLELIADGKTTKEIAVSLGISTKTAESHPLFRFFPPGNPSSA